MLHRVRIRIAKKGRRESTASPNRQGSVMGEMWFVSETSLHASRVSTPRHRRKPGDSESNALAGSFNAHAAADDPDVRPALA